MTEIDIFVDQEGNYSGFEVRGHAGYADQGQDIVCAGVSILTQTAILGLQRFLTQSLSVTIEDGYLKCILPAELSLSERNNAQIILETVGLGLEATQASYGKYVRISKRRWS